MLKYLLKKELENKIEEEPETDIIFILTDWEIYIGGLLDEIGEEVLIDHNYLNSFKPFL
jgi:hypothetical protein